MFRSVSQAGIVLFLGFAWLGGLPAQEAPPPAPSTIAGPLELTVAETVLRALESNPELAVERLNPRIARTFETEEEAVFDPVLLADDVGWESRKGEKLRGFGILETFETESPVGRLAIEGMLPTGTAVGVETSTEVADESTSRQLVQSRVGLNLSQALLRGFGPGANQARVRTARVDARISEAELQAFTAAYVSIVEQAYWDYALYRRQEQILDEMIAMAGKQLRDTEERVRVGTSARVELAAARSEVSLRNQQRIDVRSNAEKTRLVLVRMIRPGGENPWGCDLRPTEEISGADLTLEDVAAQVAAALESRPEMTQAGLLVERGDLEIVRTRNGLLPRMDLFVTLGRSGYADSFSESWKSLDSDYDDVRAGLRFEFPLRRSESRAQHERALTEREQADRAVENLRRLIETDVRSARVEVERAREQIEASSETRRLDEEKLAAEMEKFAINRASAFQVARAQRDLARSRLDEVGALADARKALVAMYWLDGSLLARRGIVATDASAGSP